MTYLPAIRPGIEHPHVTENEAGLIITAARNPRIRLFIETIWLTGLRINEVLALKAKNLQLSPDGYVLVVVRLKKRTQKQERLPIAESFGQRLRDYVIAAKIQHGDPIFPGHENAYRYQVRQCAKRAGLPNWQTIHPHSFRHGFVYQAVRDGIHPLVLTKLVGHSSLNITLGYYTPTEADLRQAMERGK